MKRIFSLILAILLSFSSLTMFGCAEQSQTENVIRVCNCEDYIDEDLLEAFTEETGIVVEYSTYGTNENLYNELVINPNSYDLVVPSEYMIEKLAQEGRIQPLKFEEHPELSAYEENLSPYIKSKLKGLEIKEGEYAGKSLYDFMVGYMWGTMGWVYNTEYVTAEEVSSWTGVFDNPSLSKKITIKDAVRDSYIVGLAMVYGEELLNAKSNEEITQILNNVNQEAVDKVEDKLNSLKPMLYGFEVDSGKNDIVLGNIYAYVAWSGDACYAIDVASGEVEDDDGSFIDKDKIRSLSYSIPKEGSNIWFDGFVMPSGSTNYDAVYKFLEFISRPENVYRNMDYTGYTGMVANGEFTIQDESGEEYQTSIFDEIFIGWFDESEYLAEELKELDEYKGKSTEEVLEIIANFSEEELIENGYGLADLSEFEYFFGEISSDYRLVISDESLGRLYAQYPTESIVNRCAVMSNFNSETLMTINDMWEAVKGETFKMWFIILIAVSVVLLGIFIVLLRNAKNIKTFKIPEKKLSALEKKGYKIIKIEEVE